MVNQVLVKLDMARVVLVTLQVTLVQDLATQDTQDRQMLDHMTATSPTSLIVSHPVFHNFLTNNLQHESTQTETTEVTQPQELVVTETKTTTVQPELDLVTHQEILVLDTQVQDMVQPIPELVTHQDTLV